MKRPKTRKERRDFWEWWEREGKRKTREYTAWWYAHSERESCSF